MTRRYIPDLSAQNAVCEANYLRLEKLLGDMEHSRYRYRWSGQGEQKVRMRADIIERFKFTTTLTLVKENQSLPKPMDQFQLTIRMYHDARMAEVVTWQSGRQFSGVYPYPNDRMYQIDEKAQANVYLGEWLAHLMQHGQTEQQWSPN